MLEVIHVHHTLGDGIDDAVITDAIPVVLMQPPFEPFNVGAGEWLVLQGIEPDLDGRFDGGIESLVLPDCVG